MNKTYKFSNEGKPLKISLESMNVWTMCLNEAIFLKLLQAVARVPSEYITTQKGETKLSTRLDS